MNIKDYVSKKILKNNLIHLPQGINKIKIDVGLSFNAPISFEWLEREKDLIVFGFEPNTQNYLTIKGDSQVSDQHKKFFKSNKIAKYLGERFFVFPYALSDENGEQQFYNVLNELNQEETGFNHESGQSSLLKPQNMSYLKSTVKVYNLFSFFSMFDWSSIRSVSQIKIDAQGEDFKIIYGLKKYIKKVEFISYEINAPGYYGYKNYRIKNLIMFLYMTLNGFYPYKKTDSEMSYKNIRFMNTTNNYYTSGN